MVPDHFIEGGTDRMFWYNPLVEWKTDYSSSKCTPGRLQPVSGMFQFGIMGSIIAGIGCPGLFPYKSTRSIILEKGGDMTGAAPENAVLYISRKLFTKR